MKSRRKKLRSIITVLTGVVLLFTACGSNESITDSEAAKVIISEAAEVNEIEITNGIDVTDIIALVIGGELPEPLELPESSSHRK